MESNRIRKFIVKKEQECIEITGIRKSGSVELKDVILIKKVHMQLFINSLKNIDHDPAFDIDDNPDENILQSTLQTIENNEYSIYIGIRKFNYSFENNELELSSFWEDDNVNSASIDISYKDYTDLRSQLDSLIAEIEKVM